MPMPPALGKCEVIDAAEAENDGFRVEILAYSHLGGARDYQTAATVYFANQAGIRLKQVRITLRESEALVESGALNFMLGHIKLESKIGGVSGLGKAMMNKFLTKEAAVMPRYRGTGQVYLEPSFSHFLIYRLNGEEMITDKGMFYCGQGALDVGAVMQQNVSSALFGGEGLFQTRIKGSGICVLESPVPADEVLRVDLKDETLQVDGNFALMRTGRIDFSVEKSTKGLLGTLTSGEGLLQTFRGTGSVWLAPTQAVYRNL
ncbi:AIM24 family protein, partial [Singulisphaera rosea]